MVLPGAMYVLTFQVFPIKNMGVWTSICLVDLLLMIAYWGRVHNVDWHARSMKIIKRTNQLAGSMPSDGLDAQAREEVEMQ